MNQDQLAYNITKALGYTENGGKPDLKNLKEGKTGEMKSIFQFEPTTWKAYAKEVLGDENAPLTPDNETHVTLKKVADWLSNGLSPEQIFSAWNAGPHEKNAYTGKFSNGHPSNGVNPKYGVQYDVPGYVKKALSYLKKFENEPQQTPMASVQPGAVSGPQEQSLPTGGLPQGKATSLPSKGMQAQTPSTLPTLASKIGSLRPLI